MNTESLTIDSEELEETSFYIVGHLRETEASAKAQIRKIVTLLGPDQALAFLKQAREVEKSGSMKTKAGKKRTVGGIFFHLVKSQSDEATVKSIWPDRPWSEVKKKRVKAS